jgi:AcrR family transcriptional regulator
MSSTSVPFDHSTPRQPGTRRRLARGDRFRQLIGVAWTIVQEEGTEALTLGHLAERAGVTKPVVYAHFKDRNGLLAALYLEFDARQCALIDQAIAAAGADPSTRAGVIADGYVDCVLAQGHEIPGIIAALSGSPELERIRRTCEAAFLDKCRNALQPASPSGHVSNAGLRAMLGAAEALSADAAAGELSPDAAKRELRETIVDMLARQR